MYAIRQADAGTPSATSADIGVSDVTFYAWKMKYGHRGVSELQRLCQLEEENSRLKRLAADLSLATHMLSEDFRNKV